MGRGAGMCLDAGRKESRETYLGHLKDGEDLCWAENGGQGSAEAGRAEHERNDLDAGPDRTDMIRCSRPLRGLALTPEREAADVPQGQRKVLLPSVITLLGQQGAS